MCFSLMIPVMCLAGLGLTGCSESPQAKESRFLEKGRNELQKKNYDIAIIYFKNALDAQPRDAEPYYQLGMSYLSAGDFTTGASYLRRATELNPKHAMAQLKLAEMMATSRSRQWVEEAEKRSLEVLTLLPDNADALNVLATSELRLGKPESAETHLEQVLRKTPDNLRSSVVLAQARMVRKDVEGAEAALKQAVQQAPKSPLPCVYLGGFYLGLGKTAEAEREYRHALEIDPQHGPALLAIAAMQVRAGEPDKAEETYRRIAALPEKQYRPAHALFLYQSGKSDQAVAEFERLAKSDASDRNLRTYLVKAYLALNRISDAEGVLTAALKRNKLDTDALLQRSQIYIVHSKFAEAEADLNQVLHYRNVSAEAHYLLSKVHQGRGENALREQELAQALKFDPTMLAVRAEFAHVLTATGAAASALKLLDEAPQEQKDTVGLVVQRNWALLALGETAEARKGVDRVLGKVKVPEARLQDATLKLTQKDYAGARSALEDVLKQDAGNVQALQLMVQTFAAQSQLPAGIQWARQYIAKQPTSPAMQQFLGQLLVSSRDIGGARQAFEAALAARPGFVYAELALSEIDISESKFADARKRLTSVLAAQPGNLAGHLLLGQVEMTEGKLPAAIEQFRKAVSLDGRNSYALNALAYVLSENHQASEALQYAELAKEVSPDDASIDDTLGWTYFQKGLYSLAVTHLQDAIAREGTPRRRYHLAMAYLKAGDPKRGRQMLDSALSMDPTLREAQIARQIFGGASN